MRNSRSRSTRRGFLPASGAAMLAAGLSLFAQSPPPASSPQPPTVQTTPPARGGAPGRGNPDAGADFSPKPPIVPLTPQEEQKRFILPPGYHLELVLSDPDIINPTAIAFDGNGRLYVNEMRSYMLDVEGSREFEPVSRISMHESNKGDGTFDKHSVFIDNLVLRELSPTLHVHNLPTLVLLAKDGTVRAVATGFTSEAELTRLVRDALR